MIEKIKNFLRHLYKNINKPEMGVLPAHLAFYFLMMLIPLLTLLGALLSSIDVLSASISDIIYDNLPKNVADVIISISRQEPTTMSLWVLLLPALVLASNGTYSMITISNSIYKQHKANYILNKIKAFFMLVILILLFIFLLLVPTFGNILFKIIGSIIANENIAGSIYHLLFNVLKYPVTFLFVFVSIKILYIMSPNKRIRGKEVNYGAFFTTVMWLVSTWAFSYYIEYFSSYETFYGGISSLLILMLWIYLISYIFVLGMALNVSEYEVIKEEKQLHKSEEIINEDIK